MCFRSRIRQIVNEVYCRFHGSSKNRNSNILGSRRRGSVAHYSVLVSVLLLQVLLTLPQQTASGAFVHAASGGATKGLGARVRVAKIAGTHEEDQQREPHGNVSLTTVQDKPAGDALLAGKYEIHAVAGEPNYKSVNLTWEVEFVPTSSAIEDVEAITNRSVEVEPPKVFQIFFCELQSFGPHRCRSKLVNESQQLEPNSRNHNSNNNNDHNNDVEEIAAEKHNRQLRHYSVQIDNLRMATKYSFHVRPQMKRRNMKITGRSELFGNEIDDELKGVAPGGGQTIIIPTKGFSAQATKCLPHASEIEVETGPYFAGKIVVDGGNCGIKGDPDDPTDRYTMRIDHKICGSLVKPETNTVETFITVQENLGIFTHSTRRFVVVCSFQSGMQTVRASFTVPGSDGVAAAVENDPFEPDDRLGREQRQMRYVDKSALVLKEHVTTTPDVVSEESEALVQEVTETTANGSGGSSNTQMNVSADVENTVAVLEDIIPGVNEAHIKHENEVLKTATSDEHSMESVLPVAHARLAKYAKLVGEQAMSAVAAPIGNDADEEEADEVARQWYGLRNSAQGRAYPSTLQYFSANSGSVLLTVSICVIILGVFIFIVVREARRQRFIRSNIRMQQLQSSSTSSSASSCLSAATATSLAAKLHVKRTMPRSLQPQHSQGTM